MLRITGSNLKVTFCTTSEVADAVVADYTRRGFEIQSTVPKSNKFVLDFGGPLLVGESPVYIDYFGFFPHQIEWVLRALGASPREGGYVKIHGQHSCLCVPAGEARRIAEAISSNLDYYNSLADAFGNR